MTNYRYQVYNEKNIELTELESTKPSKVISELTQLLYLKFINKYQYTLRIKKDIDTTTLTFKGKGESLTFKITVPTSFNTVDAFRFQIDMKNEK